MIRNLTNSIFAQVLIVMTGVKDNRICYFAIIIFIFALISSKLLLLSSLLPFRLPSFSVYKIKCYYTEIGLVHICPKVASTGTKFLYL